MGDRAWVQLRIGGEVDYEVLKEALAVDDGIDLDDVYERQVGLRPHPEKGQRHFWRAGPYFGATNSSELGWHLIHEVAEQSGGYFEELERELQYHGILYERQNAFCSGCWSDGISTNVGSPNDAMDWVTTDDGEPVAMLYYLEHVARGNPDRTVKDLVDNELRRPPELPPLTFTDGRTLERDAYNTGLPEPPPPGELGNGR